MREDVFVGTLRVVSSEEEAFSLQSRSLGYVSIHNALVLAEQQKPTYPQSGNPESLSIGGPEDNTARTVWKQPSGGSLAPNLNARPDRLRLAAIPGVSLVRVSEADLASRGLVRAIAASFRRNANLTINLKGVETLEIDDVNAAKALKFGIENPLYSDPWFGNGICTAALALKDPTLEKIQIQMVTRVFYARAIEYNYGDDASAALKQVSGSEGIIESDSVFQPSATPAGAAVEDGNQVPAANPSRARTADLSNVAPGTIAKIGVQRKDGSSLTEVFDRPLAFGVGVLAVSPKALGLECNAAGQRIKPAVFSNASLSNQPGKRPATGGGRRVADDQAVGTVRPIITPLTGPDAASCQEALAQFTTQEEIEAAIERLETQDGLQCR